VKAVARAFQPVLFSVEAQSPTIRVRAFVSEYVWHLRNLSINPSAIHLTAE
jgi:hypothetical protein